MKPFLLEVFKVRKDLALNNNGKKEEGEEEEGEGIKWIS